MVSYLVSLSVLAGYARDVQLYLVPSEFQAVHRTARIIWRVVTNGGIIKVYIMADSGKKIEGPPVKSRTCNLEIFSALVDVELIVDEAPGERHSSRIYRTEWSGKYCSYKCRSASEHFYGLPCTLINEQDAGYMWSEWRRLFISATTNGRYSLQRQTLPIAHKQLSGLPSSGTCLNQGKTIISILSTEMLFAPCTLKKMTKNCRPDRAFAVWAAGVLVYNKLTMAVCFGGSSNKEQIKTSYSTAL